MIDLIYSHPRLAACPEGRVFDRRSASPRRPTGLAAKRVTFTASCTAGFTLVELMISIALVVLLILGINTVFKYTAQAVGQGQAISTAVRDSRSAQTTMANDFVALVPNGSGATDSASLIIASMAQPAFMNAADKAADLDGNPLTTDINGNGTEGETTVPGEVISPATYNFRNHRLDTLSFFARNNFPRQTGNDGTYVDSMSSQEAWVWYGHLWLPTNDQSSQLKSFPTGAFPPNTYPGAPATETATNAGSVALNPNNVYASQFVLGRMPILLKTPTAGVISDSSSTSQKFITTPSGTVLPIYTQGPLTYDAVGTDSATTPIYQSRFDLAGTSIKTIQSQVAAALSLAVPVTTWWVPSAYFDSGSGTLLRFQANPIISKPLTAAKIAASAPYFIPGCSQFIVEYAGDFVTQDNNPSHVAPRGTAPNYTIYGDITGNAGDGQIDYSIVNGVKQIIWYGMPRNVSGAAKINFANGDVVPLRDWVLNNAYSATTGLAITFPAYAFEKVYPGYRADYTTMLPAEAKNGYICAFGPNDPAPSLIRITITLNDSAGQLPDGQTYQFVFAVAPQ